MSYTYPYPKANNTATVVVILEDQNPYNSQYLLGLRSHDTDAHPNEWSLVGGHLEPMTDTFEGETLQQCAIRELYEETHIIVTEDDLVLFDVRSDPKTDPRGHYVNTCYYVVVSKDHIKDMKANDDIQELKFKDVMHVESNLAFDHSDILKKALFVWSKQR